MTGKKETLYQFLDIQNIKNYRPVSLLPIYSNIFELIIYDNMLKYFLDNNLVTPKQPEFRPGDSCINQLLSITHYIFTSFDKGLEVREEYFCTYLKLLIRYGTMDLYIS